MATKQLVQFISPTPLRESQSEKLRSLFGGAIWIRQHDLLNNDLVSSLDRSHPVVLVGADSKTVTILTMAGYDVYIPDRELVAGSASRPWAKVARLSTFKKAA